MIGAKVKLGVTTDLICQAYISAKTVNREHLENFVGNILQYFLVNISLNIFRII